jgi:hypothetical protein
MKKKFKSGDKVKIVRKYGPSWIYLMDKTIGESGTVTNTHCPCGTYFVSFGPLTGHYYNPRSLELVPEKSPQLPLDIKKEFKVGDNVKVIKNSGGIWWSDDMKSTIDKIGVITPNEFGICSEYRRVKFDKNFGYQDNWYYHTDDLEHVEVKTVSKTQDETIKQLKRIIDLKDETIAAKDSLILILKQQVKQANDILAKLI